MTASDALGVMFGGNGLAAVVPVSSDDGTSRVELLTAVHSSNTVSADCPGIYSQNTVDSVYAQNVYHIQIQRGNGDNF